VLLAIVYVICRKKWHIEEQPVIVDSTGPEEFPHPHTAPKQTPAMRD